jgi:hypothetical protein
VRRGFLENQAYLDEQILHNLAAVEQYMDVPGVQAAYRRFLQAPMQSTDSDIFTILIAVTLVDWLRTAFSPEVRPRLPV